MYHIALPGPDKNYYPHYLKELLFLKNHKSNIMSLITKVLLVKRINLFGIRLLQRTDNAEASFGCIG